MLAKTVVPCLFLCGLPSILAATTTRCLSLVPLKTRKTLRTEERVLREEEIRRNINDITTQISRLPYEERKGREQHLQFQRALAYMKLGNLNDMGMALRDINNFIDSQREKGNFPTQAHYQRARLLLSLGTFTTKKQRLSANALFAKKNDETLVREAYSDYSQVILMDQTNIDAHLAVGHILESTNRPREALEHYDMMQSFWPNDYRIYLVRSRVKFTLGDKNGMIQDRNLAREFFDQSRGGG